MKTKWIEKTIKYDGRQLHSLYAYLNHEVLGNSIIAFQGPCDVSFDHMVDGEDLLAKSPICSDYMLHFIVEIFDEKLITGVALQRLLTTLVRDEIFKINSNINLIRKGDDLYWNQQKLNVSIATSSPRSTMIHLGINISNAGTPVPTCSLDDFDIPAVPFAKSLMLSFANEFESILTATHKVKWIP